MLNPKQISRRNFLKIIAISAVASATAKLGFKTLSAPETVSVTRLLMGTVVNLTIISDDKAAAQTAIDITFSRMSELERVLSRFQAKSQLAQLNQSGQINNTHPALLGLITQAQMLSNLSSGAFDITVKPLVDLYRQYQLEDGMLPTASKIETALALVDYRKIQIDNEQITFNRPGMAITLDGIAKGYIVDEGVSVLKQAGFNNVMVEAGGDLLASGQKSKDGLWQIGVQSPRREKLELLTKLTVQNKAVATSGDYMQPFTANLRHHHILDPRTGYSAPELAGATVIAPTAMLADGLATAVMVLGAQQGLNLIERLPDCEAILVNKSLQQFKTTSFDSA